MGGQKVKRSKVTRRGDLANIEESCHMFLAPTSYSQSIANSTKEHILKLLPNSQKKPQLGQSCTMHLCTSCLREKPEKVFWEKPKKMFATPRNGKGMLGIVEATQELKFCGRREYASHLDIQRWIFISAATIASMWPMNALTIYHIWKCTI